MKAVKNNKPRTQPGLVSQGVFKNGDTAIVESRFGKIRIDITKAIFFPLGLLGMPESTNFCLADFPDPAFSQFKILQSVDDLALSFVVLPLDEYDEHPSFHFIEKKDIEFAAGTLHIAREDLAILLITSVHPVIGSDEITLSVNVRAPLFLSTTSNTAAQYVFQSNKYQIRQMLG
jgi:flagellar assembly factor FliW